MIDQQVAVFATFALTSQTVLVVFFAARRWYSRLAERYGRIAYAFGGLGLAVGIWLAVAGAPWQLVVGPVLFAVWATYGAWVDFFRHIEWRPMVGSVPRPAIRWHVVGPYLTMYLAAQMFLWWPLWDYWRLGWTAYLILFVANTLLNIAGHFGPGWRSSARAA